MKIVAIACFILAASAQAIESFSVKVGGREFVVAVSSPPDDKLAKDPALLLTFAGERGTSLLKEPYCKAAKAFLQRGHRAASFDLPGHGDRVDKFGKSIGSFKNAFVAGTDVFANFVADGRAVISECIRRGLAKPGKIVVAGTSRGGYMALRLMAGDDRVVAGAGFAPVTDWRMLTEFVAVKDRTDVAGLRLANFAKRMTGRHVYLAIGKTDDRVGTEACCELNRALVSAGSLVEFNLTDDKGHTMGADGYEKGAQFLLQRVEPKPARPPSANSRTILFVDDEDVLYRSGTRKEVVPLRKYADNPVIAPDKPWEGMIGWVSVYRNPTTGKCQMWYQAYNEKRSEDKRLKCVVAYAESNDGKTWTKPNLGLFPYYEFKETNIVLIGAPNAYGDRYCNSVLVDPRDPDPARRYKMVYYDWEPDDERNLGAGMRVAFSADGIHWKKHEGMVHKTQFGAKGKQVPFAGESVYVEGPVKNGRPSKSWLVPLSMSDAQDVFYDDLKGCYVSYGKMWIQGPDGGTHWKHGMGRIESKDFIHWSKPQFLLCVNDNDPPQLEFHTSPVFLYNKQYFSLNQILNRSAGIMDIELMCSRDGFAWDRPYAGVHFLERSKGAAFDAATLLSNGTPLLVGDEMWFYYGGYHGTAIGGVGLGQQVIGAKDYFSGVGLAVMKKDRFVAVVPNPENSLRNSRKVARNEVGKAAPKPSKPNSIGQVTLRPLDLGKVRGITINADATKGKIAVEVLNEDGFRVRGFSKEDAIPVTGNSLAATVAWKEKNLSQLKPGRYMLRIHLDNAKLFACTLQ